MKLKMLFLLLLSCFCCFADYHVPYVNSAYCGDNLIWVSNRPLLTARFDYAETIGNTDYYVVKRFDFRFGDVHIQQPVAGYGRYWQENNYGYGFIENYEFTFDDTSLTITPEPSTILLISGGLLCLKKRCFC